MVNKYKQVNIKVQDKQLQDLDNLGVAMGETNRSALVRRAIADFIQRHKEYLDKGE